MSNEVLSKAKRRAKWLEKRQKRQKLQAKGDKKESSRKGE
jgi:hypothetical protein